MFKSISVHNFRCFRDFLIEDLQRVNVLAGVNSVGKTALLEAIFLLSGAENINLITTISALRGIDEFRGDATSIGDLLWKPLFTRLHDKAKIQIEGIFLSGERQSVELELMTGASAHLAFDDVETSGESRPSSNGVLEQFLQQRFQDPNRQVRLTKMWFDSRGIHIEPVPSTPLFPGIFLSARGGRLTPQIDAERFGRLEVQEEPYDLIEVLKIVEPRLKRVATIYSAGLPMLYGDIGLGRMLPLPLMGDGLARLTSLILAIANAPHGVILVDEIENGLHHQIQTKVWQAIHEAARRFDTQIFATTHSFECIQAAHDAFSLGTDYDFRLYRLEMHKGKIRAAGYDKDDLETALATDLEIR
jgi:predicted ATPase